jgi:hypothetical protein
MTVLSIDRFTARPHDILDVLALLFLARRLDAGLEVNDHRSTRRMRSSQYNTRTNKNHAAKGALLMAFGTCIGRN